MSVPTGLEDDFQLDPAEVEKRITPKSKALLLISPNNPTGQVLDKDRAAAIAEMAVQPLQDARRLVLQHQCIGRGGADAEDAALALAPREVQLFRSRAVGQLGTDNVLPVFQQCPQRGESPAAP